MNKSKKSVICAEVLLPNILDESQFNRVIYLYNALLEKYCLYNGENVLYKKDNNYSILVHQAAIITNTSNDINAMNDILYISNLMDGMITYANKLLKEDMVKLNNIYKERCQGV